MMPPSGAAGHAKFDDSLGIADGMISAISFFRMPGRGVFAAITS